MNIIHKELVEPGVERIFDVFGNCYLNRTPCKKLQPKDKAKLLSIINSKNIKIKRVVAWNVTEYRILNLNNKLLFWCDDAWKEGCYQICAPTEYSDDTPYIMAKTECYETDGYVNSAQQDIFDIFEAINTKRRALIKKQKYRGK